MISKMLLTTFASSIIGAPIASILKSSEAYATSQVVITIPNNIKKEERIDAGTGKWTWSKTSDEKNTYTNEYTINLNDYIATYPKILDNLFFDFDISQSMVDIYDQKKVINYEAKDSNRLYYASIQTELGQHSKKVGSAYSGKNSDYITGTYYIDYNFNKNTKILKYKIHMYSYAYNGGNGKINKVGKGTNKLHLENAKTTFDNIVFKH